MKTQQQRAAERRQQKLDYVDEQIKSGSLVVRKMTPEERERYATPSGGSPSPQRRRSGGGARRTPGG